LLKQFNFFIEFNAKHTKIFSKINYVYRLSLTHYLVVAMKIKEPPTYNVRKEWVNTLIPEPFEERTFKSNRVHTTWTHSPQVRYKLRNVLGTRDPEGIFLTCIYNKEYSCFFIESTVPREIRPCVMQQ